MEAMARLPQTLYSSEGLVCQVTGSVCTIGLCTFIYLVLRWGGGCWGGCFSVVSIDLELLQSSSPFVLALESVAGITGAINHSQLLLGLARPIASVSL